MSSSSHQLSESATSVSGIGPTLAKVSQWNSQLSHQISQNGSTSNWFAAHHISLFCIRAIHPSATIKVFIIASATIKLFIIARVFGWPGLYIRISSQGHHHSNHTHGWASLPCKSRGKYVCSAIWLSHPISEFSPFDGSIPYSHIAQASLMTSSMNHHYLSCYQLLSSSSKSSSQGHQNQHDEH